MAMMIFPETRADKRKRIITASIMDRFLEMLTILTSMSVLQLPGDTSDTIEHKTSLVSAIIDLFGEEDAFKTEKYKEIVKRLPPKIKFKK